MLASNLPAFTKTTRKYPSGFAGGRSGSKFTVRLAETPDEIDSALRLRSDVFNREMRAADGMSDGDAYDLKSRHLIVHDQELRTVGTYRLNTIETAGSVEGFYSASEFDLDRLPSEVLRNGVEIGRACIAREYRNTKVLFLLWSGLLRFLEEGGKRYFFGCCSIFTQDEGVGAAAYRKLAAGGHLHPDIHVKPRQNAVDITAVTNGSDELPPLFNMYLRLGAKVCGPPMSDHDFGTIDFFVLLDTHDLTDKYRRVFNV